MTQKEAFNLGKQDKEDGYRSRPNSAWKISHQEAYRKGYQKGTYIQ